MTEVPLVEGVEAMSLVYMLDLNPIDGVPDRVTFSPTLAEWASVIAVRVSVLIRATTPTAGYSDQGKTYDFGDGTTPVITPPAGDAFKRHIFSQTYQVRNNAQRRGA